MDAIFVRILLRDFARDFGIEFESSRHREIFEISLRAVKKLLGASLNRFCSLRASDIDEKVHYQLFKSYWYDKFYMILKTYVVFH